MSPARPSPRSWEKDLWIILTPAWQRCCQTLWHWAPSRKGLVRAWLLSWVSSPTRTRRPWSPGWPAGHVWGAVCARWGRGTLTQVLPPLPCWGTAPPAPDRLQFSVASPTEHGGLSPPGPRLLAAVPRGSWNGIPGVPGQARGIGILPALSLASAGELVTWPCA